MLYPLIGLLLGLLIGIVLPFEIPLVYSSYLSIAILAALNSVFGGVQADLEGTFDQKLFITGFFGNTILAALLTYIGDRVGIPIYYAAIFYFGTSLFSNFAKIRRYYFRTKNKKKQSTMVSKVEDQNNVIPDSKPKGINTSHSKTETEIFDDDENFENIEYFEASDKFDINDSDEEEIYEDDEELDEEQNDDNKTY
ncbi:MAG: small basic family protein [Eubacterium sp.]